MADTLMDLLPPVGWADVATRHDVAHLETVMHAKFETVDVKFTRVDERLANLERELADLRALSDERAPELRVAGAGLKSDCVGVVERPRRSAWTWTHTFAGSRTTSTTAT